MSSWRLCFLRCLRLLRVIRSRFSLGLLLALWLMVLWCCGFVVRRLVAVKGLRGRSFLFLMRRFLMIYRGRGGDWLVTRIRRWAAV